MGNKKFTIFLGAGRVHKLRGIKDSTKTDASDVFGRTYLMSSAYGPVFCRFRVFELSINTQDKIIFIIYIPPTSVIIIYLAGYNIIL